MSLLRVVYFVTWIGALCATSVRAAPTHLATFVDACTHTVSSRTEVTEKFTQNGWELLGPDYPSWLSNLLADGHLLWYLDTAPNNQQLNFLGVDTEHAILPEMHERMAEMVEAVSEGKTDIAFSNSPSNAVVFINWLPEGEPVSGTTCYLYGESLSDMDALLEAFDRTIHDHLVRITGPTKVYSAYFRGYPPPKEYRGFYRLMINLGWLPERPISDPPIGAGPSTMWVHIYDIDEFSLRYDRSPHASYFVSAQTEPFNEVPQ